MKTLTTLCMIALGLLVGCTTALPAPSVVQTKPLGAYKWVQIPDTGTVIGTSGSFSRVGGTLTTREVNGSSLIEGVLLRKGLVRISNITDSNRPQTLVTRWAVSGKRDVNLGLGYSQEVTITLLDGVTITPVFTCSAEGIGRTEADDVREAILRCLSSIH